MPEDDPQTLLLSLTLLSIDSRYEVLNTSDRSTFPRNNLDLPDSTDRFLICLIWLMLPSEIRIFCTI